MRAPYFRLPRAFVGKALSIGERLEPPLIEQLLPHTNLVTKIARANPVIKIPRTGLVIKIPLTNLATKILHTNPVIEVPRTGLVIKISLTNLVTKILAAALFVVLVALLAQVRFQIPETPVPVTLQTFGVILAGGFLGWRWGALSMLAYYAVGLAGVPVFNGWGGGWEHVSGATGGFLLGFVLMAGLAGLLTQIGVNRWESTWAMLVSGAIVYVPGLIWLSFYVPDDRVLSLGFYPFIPGDLIKILAASLILGGFWMLSDRRRNRNAPEDSA